YAFCPSSTERQSDFGPFRILLTHQEKRYHYDGQDINTSSHKVWFERTETFKAFNPGNTKISRQIRAFLVSGPGTYAPVSIFMTLLTDSYSPNVHYQFTTPFGTIWQKI